MCHLIKCRLQYPAKSRTEHKGTKREIVQKNIYGDRNAPEVRETSQAHFKCGTVGVSPHNFESNSLNKR